MPPKMASAKEINQAKPSQIQGCIVYTQNP